jgi:two-component system, chemotaxis family, response regulator WspR
MNEADDTLNATQRSPEQYTSMVLLVDDQAMIGEAIRRALHGQPNMEFHYCSDPGRAVDIAERIRPTVILQDLVMPNIDGLALVRQYRRNPLTKDIPIIVLSTKEEGAIKSDTFAAGANDYLVKLPDNVELIARIRYHSKGYLTQLQRDEAYRALRESQQALLERNIELARLTNVDGLTGLNNRRYFEEFAEIQWKLAIREKLWISILMIDVDDFKKYNDTYGHLAGDDVLRDVGSTIKKCAERPMDLVARFGGEEFIVILPGSSAEGSLAIGDRVCRDVKRLNISHSGSIAGPVVTVSVGSASAMPLRGDSLLVLIKSADNALYEAKHAGKNRAAVRTVTTATAI